MNILVIGNEISKAECIQKFGEKHTCEFAGSPAEAIPKIERAEVAFDFLSASNADGLKIYEQHALPVFLDTTFTTLSGLVRHVKAKATFIGFCGLPTFINRELLEVCLLNERDKSVLEEVCKKLDMKYGLVADQAGFVTPRIICAIINEAYYTAEEGTASRADIDLAMKLGTNYPFGPFEWAQRMGIENVVQLLLKVQQATQDERYRVCDLLKSEIRQP
ncbi:MAG: 3-hydroxyacyl-CoA dehydrogenase [Cyclobacteriaceae bacterium]|nr:3-hydroxyacyl-CoA dehydrogenase [Cyclobacteriaceae bacterium]